MGVARTKKRPKNSNQRKSSPAGILADGKLTVQRLINKASAAMFIFQGEKNILVNRAAEVLTGYKRKELLKMDFWEIMHADFKERVRQAGISRQRRGRVPLRYEVKIVRKDGVERWLDYSGAPIEIAGKAAVIGTAIDITESKRAQGELSRRLRQLQILHETYLATSSNLALETVLNILLEKIESLFPVPIVAVIRIMDEKTGEPTNTATRNITEAESVELVPHGGRGLSRQVLETRAPMMVVEANADPRVRYPEFFRRLGLVSYLGLPLTKGASLIGDIGLYTKVKYQFSPEEIRLVSTLASQAAIAIHNSGLYEDMKRKTEELAALHAVTRATTQSLDLNLVLQEAVQSIARVCRFDGARIYLFNEVAQEANLKANFESVPGSWSLVKTVSRGEGIIGKVAEMGEPEIFEDIRSNARYALMSQTRGARDAEGRFFGVFPIRTKLKSWGALSCMAKTPRRPGTEEIDLIVAMCDQVGVAIENASLYQTTLEKAKELSTLYSVVADSMRFLDTEELLRQTMRKVSDVFGFNAARIYLREDHQNGVRLVAQEGLEKSVAPPERYALGEGLIGRVAQTGEPIVFADMQHDPEYHRLAGPKIMLLAGFRGSFFIPLKVRDETIGVMNFVSRTAHPVSASDIQLINAIAYHIGIAVGNAKLFSQLRQQTFELEKADKAKNEFLGIISHELRTPLSLIIGYTDYVKQSLQNELTPQVEAVIAKVGEHAKMLSSLVERILVTTNIEAGMIELTLTDVDLEDWLDQVRFLYTRPDGEKVRLIWSIPPNLPVIRTDGVKLRQILQNLIDNAIKFTEEGSVEVAVHASADQETIRIEVHDTGIGIADEEIPQIFNIFRQADSSPARAHEGVGLGLYIVKRLVELLNGRVEVESELGKGSVFSIEIPDMKDQPLA
jgi:PAS domain S-box-containing protein